MAMYDTLPFMTFLCYILEKICKLMLYIGFILHAQGIMEFVVFVCFKTMYTFFSIQFELHLILPVATSKTLNINQVLFSSKLYGIV